MKESAEFLSEIESFKMPAVWNDDDAMFNLMQPIRRPRHVDPDTYNYRIAFWTSLVSDYCRSRRVLVVSIRTLSAVFSRYFAEEQVHLSPACLGEVLRVLEKSGDIKAFPEFSFISMLRNGLHYILSLPFSLFSQKSNDSTDRQLLHRDPESFFVFQKFVDVLLEEFLKHFNYTKAEKRLLLSLPAYELSDFESCLAEFFPHDLTRRYIRTVCIEHYRCVEVAQTDSYGPTSVSNFVWVSEHPKVPVSTFSRSDGAKSNFSALVGLARLRVAISHQEQEERRLSTRINDRRCEIRTLLHANRLREATTLLRRTKILEKSLEQKQSQLQHLEALQLQIVSSSDNQVILRTLIESSRALKQLTGGLSGIDLVEDTMNNLAESFRETNDVSDLICSLGRTSLHEIDDHELESELRNLSKSSNPIPDSFTTPSSCADGLDAEPTAPRLDNLALPELPKTHDQSFGWRGRSFEEHLSF